VDLGGKRTCTLPCDYHVGCTVKALVCFEIFHYCLQNEGASELEFGPVLFDRVFPCPCEIGSIALGQVHLSVAMQDGVDCGVLRQNIFVCGEKVGLPEYSL